MAKTSKITAIVPKMKNGTHESFPNKTNGKLLYVFVADIEGEGKGEFFSSMPEAKWKIGMTVNYEMTPQERAEGGKRFKILEEVTANGQKKGGYNDPINNKRTAFGMAQANASLTIRNLEVIGTDIPYRSVEDVMTIGHKYYDWITEKQTLVDRDILGRRWYAVEWAANFILMKKIEVPKEGITNWILDNAQKYMDEVMKIQAPAEI